MGFRFSKLLLFGALFLGFSPPSAFALPAIFEQLSAQDLEQVKLQMEAKLAEKSGHPAMCEEATTRCIESFEKLLAFDWAKSTLTPGKKIVVSTALASSERRDYYVVNPDETGGRMKLFLGADPYEAASQALDFGHALDALNRWEARNCPGLSPAELAPKACPGKQKYYDDLFKNGGFEATLVRGYYDQHDESISGIIAEQFLHSKVLPVSIDDNARDVEVTIESLKEAGFKVESEGPNHWIFTRTFLYKGEPKTARVRFYNSTTACAGENIMHGIAYRKDNELCPEQLKATLDARQAFADAFGRSQFIMYAGHSRLGKGPDFGPLSRSEGKFSIANGALDRVDLKDTKTTLMLGSCQSLKYFEKAVQKKQQAMNDPEKLAFLGTTADASWQNLPREFSRFLAMTMEAKCPADITDAINLPRDAAFGYQFEYSRQAGPKAPQLASPGRRIPQCHTSSSGRRICGYGFAYVKDENGENVCKQFEANGQLITVVNPTLCDDQNKAGNTQLPVNPHGTTLDLGLPHIPR